MYYKHKNNNKNNNIVVSDNHIVYIQPENSNFLSCSAGSQIIEISFNQDFIDQIDIRCWDKSLIDHLNIRTNEVLHIYSIETMYFTFINNTINTLIREFTEKSAGYKTMIRLKFIELVLFLCRISKPENKRNKNRSSVWNIDDVLTFIQENYSNNITLHEIAGRCALNSNYFSRAFKERAGIPLFEYINRIRIQKSCLLLKR